MSPLPLGDIQHAKLAYKTLENKILYKEITSRRGGQKLPKFAINDGFIDPLMTHCPNGQMPPSSDPPASPPDSPHRHKAVPSSIEIKQLREILAQCPPIGIGLLKEKSKQYDPFTALWDNLRKLGETVVGNTGEERTES